MSELKIGNCPKCGNKGIHACTGKIEKLPENENIFIYQGDINKPLFSNEPEEYKVSPVLLSLQAELDEANNRINELVIECDLISGEQSKSIDGFVKFCKKNKEVSGGTKLLIHALSVYYKKQLPPKEQGQ